ncbi:MAG: SUMF1/EgtB/PvdO family nonheme iron enzyme [Anaerolineales bacterium]|nr:MAG: SUMF1/EgtB/PvdO family nonheme iron enzyme [Anaerolineales bacterium]
MNKIFPTLVALALFVSACQLGGGQSVPTAIPVSTAFPTNTPPAMNPTAEASEGQAGAERVSSVDGMPQIYIPDGTFRMGAMDPGEQKDEVPVHNVTLKGYWMDKLEVTNGMYTLCVQAGACEPPQNFKSGTRNSYFNNTEFNDFPVVYVTWAQARTYCTWAGRRLPTEAEWERAARGDDFRTYPWGDERPDSSHGNFNYYVGDTTRVGSFPAGASPYGILDLAGNVAEWVNDYYDSEYYSKGVTMNPPGPGERSKYFNRVVRGGTYQDAFKDIRLANRASVRGSNLDASDIYSADYLGEFSPKIGFRCASD